MYKGNRKKVFTSHQGLFPFMFMPFGLERPGTFQGDMDVRLAIFEWQFVLVYHYNFISFFMSLSKQVTHVCLVRHLFSDAGVTLTLNKCSLTKPIGYLGHIVCPGKLQTVRHTSDAICSLKGPRKVTVLRSFFDQAF